MKKLGAGVLVLLIKIGPKILSVFAKLAKSAKVVKGALAIGSFAAYAYLFTWQFAALIIVSLFIHELGHIYAMKKVGIKTKGVYFIPFLGAAAVADSTFSTRQEECYVALMGPLWGLVTAIILFIIYFVSGIDFFGGAAAWVALVNIFNLLPINPLDGGRVFKSVVMSINKWFGLTIMGITVAGCIIMTIVSGMGLFGFLALIGLVEFLLERWKMLKIQKKYDETILLYEHLQQIDPSETIIDRKPPYFYYVKAEIESTRLELDKLKKNLPPLKLKYSEMIKWGAIYMLLITILWGLMQYLSAIPGVEMAIQMMAS